MFALLSPDIAKKRLEAYGKAHANARASLASWEAIVSESSWKSIIALRKTYPNADSATVASGKTVTIFNISGNHEPYLHSCPQNRRR